MFSAPLLHCRTGMLLLMLCSGSSLAAPQDRVAKEMVQVLEAYAVYKMGQYDEAYARYLKLAKAGNRQGMLNLGNMHAAGQGVARDQAKALQWYQRAAEAGDATGMFEVARAYEQGLGIPADKATAMDWYRRSAEADNSTAQWLLGQQLYQQGEQLQGLSWIRSAARQEEQSAQQFLGTLEGSAKSALAPSAVNKTAIFETLSTIDSAAQAQDAQGIVGMLSPDAQIRVRLPGSSAWNNLSHSEWAALWQATFDRVENYRYRRTEPELLAAEDGILVFSIITEHLGSSNAPQVLELHEQALFRVSTGRALIHALRVDIRRQGE